MQITSLRWASGHVTETHVGRVTACCEITAGLLYATYSLRMLVLKKKFEGFCWSLSQLWKQDDTQATAVPSTRFFLGAITQVPLIALAHCGWPQSPNPAIVRTRYCPVGKEIISDTLYLPEHLLPAQSKEQTKQAGYSFHSPMVANHNMVWQLEGINQ